MSSIAILTPSFDFFDPAYSLSHVISDQSRCLVRAGHEATVFVSEEFKGDLVEMADIGVIIYPVLPSLGLSSDKVRVKTQRILQAELSNFDVVFTHDWISHSRMTPLYEGLVDYVVCSAHDNSAHDNFSPLSWYHWIHSAPIGQTYKRDLSWLSEHHNHKLVYPLACDVPLVSRHFRIAQDHIITIPHIVDEDCLLTYSNEMPALSQSILDLTTDAEIVQVYPVSADRLIWKGVDKLVKLFGAIKAEGHSVCCVILDSWTGRLPREDLSRYRSLMRQACLTEEEFVFASQIDPEFRGISRGEVYRLMLVSSICAVPSMGEAFGLVLPESILAGNLPICNASLLGSREICKDYGIHAEFGSCQNPKPYLSPRFFSDLAQKIDEGLQKKFAIPAKSYIQRTFRMDQIYEQYYRLLLQTDAGLQVLRNI